MEQYEAGNKFLELFRDHPDDFTVTTESGRDGNVMTIKSRYRAVSVSLSWTSNKLSPLVFGQDAQIQFITEEALTELHRLGNEHIFNQKVQDRIKKDNTAINNLIDYYEN